MSNTIVCCARCGGLYSLCPHGMGVIRLPGDTVRLLQANYNLRVLFDQHHIHDNAFSAGWKTSTAQQRLRENYPEVDWGETA